MRSGSVLRARTLRRLRPPHQLRQLGDVGGDAPGLVAGEEVCVDPLELVANPEAVDKSL